MSRWCHWNRYIEILKEVIYFDNHFVENRKGIVNWLRKHILFMTRPNYLFKRSRKTPATTQVVLIMTECLNRRNSCSLQGLIGDGGGSQDESNRTGRYKYRPGELDTISKRLKPSPHNEVGDRGGNHKGD